MYSFSRSDAACDHRCRIPHIVCSHHGMHVDISRIVKSEYPLIEIEAQAVSPDLQPPKRVSLSFGFGLGFGFVAGPKGVDGRNWLSFLNALINFTAAFFLAGERLFFTIHLPPFFRGGFVAGSNGFEGLIAFGSLSWVCLRMGRGGGDFFAPRNLSRDNRRGRPCPLFPSPDLSKPDLAPVRPMPLSAYIPRGPSLPSRCVLARRTRLAESP